MGGISAFDDTCENIINGKNKPLRKACNQLCQCWKEWFDVRNTVYLQLF